MKAAPSAVWGDGRFLRRPGTADCGQPALQQWTPLPPDSLPACISSLNRQPELLDVESYNHKCRHTYISIMHVYTYLLSARSKVNPSVAARSGCAGSALAVVLRLSTKGLCGSLASVAAVPSD